MTLYISSDIKSSIEGDIKIDTNGDLALANPLETYKAAANFVLRTNYGDYAPNNTVGCNIGAFIGKMNTPENHRSMEYNVNKVLKEKIFSSSDIDATVTAFDINECICFVKIAGSYLIDNIITSANEQIIAYTFPYLGAEYLTPLPIE